MSLNPSLFEETKVHRRHPANGFPFALDLVRHLPKMEDRVVVGKLKYSDSRGFGRGWSDDMQVLG
jgi:hypothetical protein